MGQKPKKTKLKKIKSYLLFFIKLAIPFYIIRAKKILTTGKDIEKHPLPTKGYFRAYFCEPDRDGCTWRHHEMPLYLADKFHEDYKGKLVGLTREEVVRWVLENQN
jgi:hypothetical protein